MALAIAYPDPETGGRSKKRSTQSIAFSADLLSSARLVLRQMPDWCHGVSSATLLFQRDGARNNKEVLFADRSGFHHVPAGTVFIVSTA